MRFKQGDEVYNALVNTAGHELYVATENLKMFNRSVELTKDADKSVLLDAMSYQ